MVDDYTKAPRLYGDYDMRVDATIILNDEHNHYLLSVMRREIGDLIRMFNGRDGEFVGRLDKTGKKTASLKITEQIREQPTAHKRKALYFAPIKKDRLAFLIEKAVELGVTDLYPVLTDHTENRHPKMDKIEKYIIEAAEQCERLTIPTLHPLTDIQTMLDNETSDICAAIERADAPLFQPHTAENYACLIGPEGGWSASEIDCLTNASQIKPVSLGDTILRAETAAIYMLARLP